MNGEHILFHYKNFYTQFSPAKSHFKSSVHEFYFGKGSSQEKVEHWLK